LNFIWTFSAKRLQIERLELGIWYDLGISKELLKSLCRPFAVKESAEKESAEKHLIGRLVVEGFLDHSRQAFLPRQMRWPARFIPTNILRCAGEHGCAEFVERLRPLFVGFAIAPWYKSTTPLEKECPTFS
jgi:hypothetical protein